MRHATMSTTYKPALLKALVRASRKNDALEIPLLELGHEIAKMYWNQTVVYHLRQAAVIGKEAEVVRRLRALSTEYDARAFSDLPPDGRRRVETSMSRVLAINVLELFHRSKPLDMQPLYVWRKGSAAIALTAASSRFIREHGNTLELIANYHWANYLEGCNRLAPRIIQKVARDGAKRGALVKYLKLLTDDGTGACFYCERAFTAENGAVVDHVIPWSFLLEDPLWDLVPACARCNAQKSDWLPEAKYLDRLLVRNARVLRARVGTKVSLLVGSDDAQGLYEAAVSVEWPGYWSPASKTT